MITFRCASQVDPNRLIETFTALMGRPLSSMHQMMTRLVSDCAPSSQEILEGKKCKEFEDNENYENLYHKLSEQVTILRSPCSTTSPAKLGGRKAFLD